MAGEDWRALAAVSQKILQDSIPKEYTVPADKLPPSSTLDVHNFPVECGMLTPKEILITGTDSTHIVKYIATSQWSAEEVIIAFSKRAVVAHQVINYATEFMIPEAIARARELDAYLKEHGKPIGPLHGLPVSVKEHVGLKDRITHTGYVAWIRNITPEDALLVKYLKDAGAIFYVRTNEPQTLMHIDTNNNITGRTDNSYNRNLTCGGSSGGEGACLGIRASPMGLGTDIGGSIRVPAAFNGVYGFRPTMLRMPYGGTILAGEGQESIRCVIGPLGQSVDDLELFMKSVIDQEPWELEPSLVPVPWRTAPEDKNITIGVMWDDGDVSVHPPLKRALKGAVAKLKSNGFKVVDWEPYKTEWVWSIVAALYFPDKGKTQLDIIAETGEPIMPLSSWALSLAGKEMTVPENWLLNTQRDIARAKYNELMKERGVDVILCPTYVGVAAEHGTGQYFRYTAIWNILDHPACVFPTGEFVDQDLDVAEKDYTPRNKEDEREWKKYSPEKYAGAPIALQLVGKHFGDEKLLSAARLIDRVLKSK